MICDKNKCKNNIKQYFKDAEFSTKNSENIGKNKIKNCIKQNLLKI